MEKMPMKLPPLAVWCGNRQGATVEGLHPHSLTVDQAAHIIRIVEVVHPRMVEAMSRAKFLIGDDRAMEAYEVLDAILKEVQ